MESDRKLKLTELRQKRLEYYQRNASKCKQKDEEIETEKTEYDYRPINTKERLTDKHKKVNGDITASLSSLHRRSPDTDYKNISCVEQPNRQQRNVTHSLNFDQEELINQCFDEPHRVTRSTEFAPSRCESEIKSMLFSIHDVRNTHPQTLHQSRNYLSTNKSSEWTEKPENIKTKGSLDCKSSHRMTRTKKNKAKDKYKKRNGDEESKHGVEKKPPSPSLPDNFFDLDSLQKAARDGDDVLRKYIKDLSTKMVDSQTRIKVDTKDHLHYDVSSEQNTYSNLFLSKRDAPKRQDSNDSPPDEDNYFFQKSNRFDTNPTNSYDFKIHNDENIPIKRTAFTEDQLNVQYVSPSLEFEDRKSNYVPRISRPAIESSQLKRWGLYDDLESNLSLPGSTEEDEDVHPSFGSKDQNENHFDLLTHRPSNRTFSPLFQSTSDCDIYETSPNVTTNSLICDDINLTTHRPTNTEDKLFERVNEFYLNGRSPRPSAEPEEYCFPIEGNNDLHDLLKTYNDDARSTSPEQHILGVKKYHNMEKQRKRSKNQKIGERLLPSVNYEELEGVGTKMNGNPNHQEIKFDRNRDTCNSEDHDINTKFKIDLMSPRIDSEVYISETEVCALSMSPTLAIEDTPLYLEHEIKVNDTDDIQDNFLRNKENESYDAFEPDQEDLNSKQNFESPLTASQGKTFNFYDKQFNSIPLCRSPEPRLSTDLSPKSTPAVEEVLDVKVEDVSLDVKECQDDFGLYSSNKADVKRRKPLGMKLDLSFNNDDDDDEGRQLETYRVKTPLLKKILENENKTDLNLEVIEDKKMRSNSPLNSRKKTGNRLLDRGQSQKQRWSTSSSLPTSVLATRKYSHLSSSLKDSKRNSTRTSLKLSGKDVALSREVSSSHGKLQERCSPANKLKRLPQKIVSNGSFFTVTPTKNAEFNGGNRHFQQEYIPPLTLQLLSDSPRGGEGLSLWQLLPDELLFHIFSYLPPSSLAVTAQVCQTFHRIANDDLLWKIITLHKKQLTDDWLIQIGEKHPTDISFLQCNGAKVSEEGLRAMFRECAMSLKKLNVSGSTGGDLIGDSILLHASRCLKLTSLDVSWCSITNNGLSSIAETIEMLEVLCLNGCQAITDDSINMILQKHCKSIVVLELFGCFNISPSVMSQIGKLCRNLHTLNVGQCYKMTDGDMSSLVSHLERVQHLDMRGCKQIHNTTVCKLVRCCKKLRSISLANCGHINDSSLIEISTYLPTIRTVDVSGCKKITNQGVYSLAKSCYQLSSLDISSTSVTSKSVSSLSSYCAKSLETLKLNFCKDMTEKSILKLLQHCQKLRMLQLYGLKGLRNLGPIKNQYPGIKFD